jgi:hypothetical protein
MYNPVLNIIPLILKKNINFTCTIIISVKRRVSGEVWYAAPIEREEYKMVDLFYGLMKIFAGYITAVIIGGMFAYLIGVPVTFLNVGGILLIMVISAFLASSRDLSELETDEKEEK